jgi:hypothetical protein
VPNENTSFTVRERANGKKINGMIRERKKTKVSLTLRLPPSIHQSFFCFAKIMKNSSGSSSSGGLANFH